MEFDCRKPLGSKLELYLSDNLEEMCNELYNNGIIFEYQFEKLISMVCKNNAHEIVELLSKRTELEIRYGYDNQTNNFMFYDENRYTMKEAIKKSIAYQKSQGNY